MVNTTGERGQSMMVKLADVVAMGAGSAVLGLGIGLLATTQACDITPPRDGHLSFVNDRLNNDLPRRAHWMRTLCNDPDGVNCAWNGDNSSEFGHPFYSVKRTLLDVNGQVIGKVWCHYYAEHHWTQKHHADNCQVTSIQR